MESHKRASERSRVYHRMDKESEKMVDRSAEEHVRGGEGIVTKRETSSEENEVQVGAYDTNRNRHRTVDRKGHSKREMPFEEQHLVSNSSTHQEQSARSPDDALSPRVRLTYPSCIQWDRPSNENGKPVTTDSSAGDSWRGNVDIITTALTSAAIIGTRLFRKGPHVAPEPSIKEGFIVVEHCSRVTPARSSAPRGEPADKAEPPLPALNSKMATSRSKDEFQNVDLNEEGEEEDKDLVVLEREDLIVVEKGFHYPAQ